MLRIVFLLFFAAPLCAGTIEARTGGPYVPTPQPVVDEMLKLARVTREDFVIDLGSGDGRIVLTAATRYSARGRGIELDHDLVEESNREARRRGVAGRVQFRREDALKARVDDATVLTLYLLPELLHALRDRVFRELRPGARVVSHDFRFNDWAPDRTVTVDVAEKYGTAGMWQSTLYLWIVPAKVAGRWHAALGNSGANYIFSFDQKFQHVEGHALNGNERIALEGVQLQSDTIRFRLQGGGRGGSREFTGTVKENAIEGIVTSQEGSAPWRATRVGATAAINRVP